MIGQKSGGRTEERAMHTLNQLIRLWNISKERAMETFNQLIRLWNRGLVISFLGLRLVLWILFIIKLLFLIFFWGRAMCLLFDLLGGVLPLPMCFLSDFDLLQYSLSKPHQDPEWVSFVQTTLLSSPPAELVARCQSFCK